MSIKTLPHPIASATPPERVPVRVRLPRPGVWSLKVGPDITGCLDDRKDLRSQVSLPVLLLEIRAIQTAPLSEGARQLLPTPSSSVRAPASQEGLEQADGTFLWESGGTSPSGYCTACLPQPLAVHSVPKCKSHGTLNGMWCPPYQPVSICD